MKVINVIRYNRMKSEYIEKFYTSKGYPRLTGYVAFDDKRAFCRKTKKEAIEAYYKSINK